MFVYSSSLFSLSFYSTLKITDSTNYVDFKGQKIDEIIEILHHSKKKGKVKREYFIIYKIIFCMVIILFDSTERAYKGCHIASGGPPFRTPLSCVFPWPTSPLLYYAPPHNTIFWTSLMY